METSSGLSVPITTPERESTFAFELQPREWGRESLCVCCLCLRKKVLECVRALERKWSFRKRESEHWCASRREKSESSVACAQVCVCACVRVAARGRERGWRKVKGFNVLASRAYQASREAPFLAKKLHLRCCCRVAAAVNFGNLVIIASNLVPKFLPRRSDPIKICSSSNHSMQDS